jgi:hypothetical protein
MFDQKTEFSSLVKFNQSKNYQLTRSFYKKNKIENQFFKNIYIIYFIFRSNIMELLFFSTIFYIKFQIKCIDIAHKNSIKVNKTILKYSKV